MEEKRIVAVIGGGAFGTAIASLLKEHSLDPVVVDVGETLVSPYEAVVLAVPVAQFRSALLTNSVAFTNETLTISCSKGIEGGALMFPHQIYKDTATRGSYVSLSGPSFAREIIDQVPTVVDCASNDFSLIGEVRALLETSYFKVEAHDSVMEIELAGALKNVYAIAAGFVAGMGGGANTHAQVQVVALREYQSIAEVFTGRREVVRPSIVGDLHLTCSSTQSRNYRYGFERASGGLLSGETVEGINTVEPLLTLATKAGVSLPLAESVKHLIEEGKGARDRVFSAIGF